jgi:hypothetical protein
VVSRTREAAAEEVDMEGVDMVLSYYANCIVVVSLSPLTVRALCSPQAAAAAATAATTAAAAATTAAAAATTAAAAVMIAAEVVMIAIATMVLSFVVQMSSASFATCI